jgi:hypothetical protein
MPKEKDWYQTLIRIHLYLQRPASEKEILSYQRYQRRWEAMDFTRRPSRVRDLMPDDAPGAKVVYYATREEPLANDIFTNEARIERGVPGANDKFKRVVSRMISLYRRPEHGAFYVVGEFAERGVRAPVFRTIVARTEL